MEELIKQAFLHVDVIGPHVHEGHYDLVGPDGEIILPQVWETMIQPDWAITMHMWPMPEPPPKPEPVPEQLPPPPPFMPMDARMFMAQDLPLKKNGKKNDKNRKRESMSHVVQVPPPPPGHGPPMGGAAPPPPPPMGHPAGMAMGPGGPQIVTVMPTDDGHAEKKKKKKPAPSPFFRWAAGTGKDVKRKK
jgi:hypothetical protein